MKELWEHCLCPTHARIVTTPVMKENDKVAQLADESCSWESIQMDAGGGRLSEEEIWVFFFSVLDNHIMCKSVSSGTY